jgi:hypothetical protein
MGYGDENCPFTCPITEHYSNQNVYFATYPGTPTGNLMPNQVGQSRFNARTATLYARDMQNFRAPIADLTLFSHGFEALPDISCMPGRPDYYPNCPAP